MKKRIFVLALAAVLLLSLAACGAKQGAGSDGSWKPTKPVTVICPYGAGGGQDVAARLFAQYAEKYAGVKFVVDNKTGGSGTIGNTAIATAAPDGYTLGMFHNLSLYDQYLVDGVTYTEDSFIQLAIFCADSTVIVANKGLGVSSIDELVALAKTKPGEITWGGPEFSSQTYPRMNVENATGASDEIVKFYDDVFTQVMNDADFQKELAESGFNFLNIAGHEAATKYMQDDFAANKDNIMAAANAQ